MRRIVFFLLTNFAVMLVLGIVMSILRATGLLPPEQELTQWIPLAIMALLWGFGGSLISLFLSKTMAKRSVGASVITQPSNEMEQWLMQTVAAQAQHANIAMPEVAIFDSPTMNAFATGATKNNSLVAVSTGLLRSMKRDEVEAVLGHEVAHVANGDMVTMALLQGVLNAFVIFFSRAVAMTVSSFLSRGSGSSRRSSGGPIYYALVFVLDMVFGILATVVAMWFSRMREFRADEGAARLIGSPDAMVRALQRLKSSEPADLPATVSAFGILGQAKSLLSSHPPLDRRIEALQNLT